MSDPAPAPAPVDTATPSSRSRAPIPQAFSEELNLAESLASTAGTADYASRLAEEAIDTEFLLNLRTQIKSADDLIGNIAGKSADKKATTQQEEKLKTALVAQIKKVQARAKRKYLKPADPMREKYFIGERLDSNRPLLVRSTHALLQTLATDALPGHKPADTAALAAALDAYANIQTAQTGGQAGTTQAHAQLEAQVKIVADLRRALQYAADILWPAADKANAGSRQAFALPPNKAFR
jgi:hypothetical protein